MCSEVKHLSCASRELAINTVRRREVAHVVPYTHGPHGPPCCSWSTGCAPDSSPWRRNRFYRHRRQSCSHSPLPTQTPQNQPLHRTEHFSVNMMCVQCRENDLNACWRNLWKSSPNKSTDRVDTGNHHLINTLITAEQMYFPYALMHWPLSQRVGASSVLSVGFGEFLRMSGELQNSYWEAVYIWPSEKNIIWLRLCGYAGRVPTEKRFSPHE